MHAPANDNEIAVTEGCGNVFEDLDCDAATVALAELYKNGGITFAQFKERIGKTQRRREHDVKVDRAIEQGRLYNR